MGGETQAECCAFKYILQKRVYMKNAKTLGTILSPLKSKISE